MFPKDSITIFIVFLWLGVFIILIILALINKSEMNRNSRTSADKNYYLSTFEKIDKLIEKGKEFREHNDVGIKGTVIIIAIKGTIF